MTALYGDARRSVHPARAAVVHQAEN